MGGQAVLEGVMMRSPSAWGIACRKANGELVRHAEPLERPSAKRKWLGWPGIRGVATLGQAMTLGFRALRFSADVALEDEAQKSGEKKQELTNWMMIANLILSLGFFIAFYKFLPLLLTSGIQKYQPALENTVLFNLVDGLIRIALFLGFMWAIAQWQDIRRVFMYHGAEHKTVFAFEAGGPMTVDRAQQFVTWHPRCGTSFLMTVMMISIAVYSLFPVETFWAKFAVRIVMLPVIAGISYEIIRFAARRSTSVFALMTRPGLWLQRITTQPCDDAQVECAIVALDEAMALEKQRGGQLVLA